MSQCSVVSLELRCSFVSNFQCTLLDPFLFTLSFIFINLVSSLTDAVREMCYHATSISRQTSTFLVRAFIYFQECS